MDLGRTVQREPARAAEIDVTNTGDDLNLADRRLAPPADGHDPFLGVMTIREP